MSRAINLLHTPDLACYSCRFDTRGSAEYRSNVQHVKIGPVIVCHMCMGEQKFRALAARVANAWSPAGAVDSSASLPVENCITVHSLFRSLAAAARVAPGQAEAAMAWIARGIHAYMTYSAGMLDSYFQDPSSDPAWTRDASAVNTVRDLCQRRVQLLNVARLLLDAAPVLLGSAARRLKYIVAECHASTSDHMSATASAIEFLVHDIDGDAAFERATGCTLRLTHQRGQRVVEAGACDAVLLTPECVPYAYQYMAPVVNPTDIPALCQWATGRGLPPLDDPAHIWKLAVQAGAQLCEVRALLQDAVTECCIKKGFNISASSRTPLACGMDAALFSDVILEDFYRLQLEQDDATQGAVWRMTPLHLNVLCELDHLLRDAMRQRRSPPVPHPATKLPSHRKLRAVDLQRLCSMWETWMAHHATQTSAFEYEAMRLDQIVAVYWSCMTS